MNTRLVRGIVMLSAVLALVCTVPSARAEGTISFLAGVAQVDGEVGDLLTGDGLSFGVSGHTMAGTNVSFGGGVNVMVFEGAELEYMGQSVELYDSVAGATLQASLRIYPIPTRPGARLYIGGIAGFGALAWEYNPGADLDSDGIGFLFIGPEAGLELFLGERFFLEGSARYLATSYAEETTEGYEWGEPDGGDIILAQVGIGFGF